MADEGFRLPWVPLFRRFRRGWSPVVEVLRWAVRYRSTAVPYVVLKAVFEYPIYLLLCLVLVKNYRELVELFLVRNSRRLIRFRFGLGKFRPDINYLLTFVWVILKGVLYREMKGRMWVTYKGILVSVPCDKEPAMLADLPLQPLMYHVFDYSGRRVLDVGGYLGETAALFHRWGADWVEVFEPLEEHSRHARETLVLNGVKGVVHSMFVDGDCENCGRSISWAELLRETKFDVAKVDCEGCELGLTSVDEELIRRIPMWVIECHGKHTFLRVAKKFKRAGFNVWFRNYIWSGHYFLLGEERMLGDDAEIYDGLIIMVAQSPQYFGDAR